MKKRIIVFLASLLALGACTTSSPKVLLANNKASVDFSEIGSNDYTPNQGHSGDIGDFSLISPTNGKTLDKLETFNWSEATNADKYTIEICSDSRFISDNYLIDYYKQENIHSLHWNVTAQLALQNQDYFWRVTAFNRSGSKQCSEVFSFYMKAPEVQEVLFDIGEADDWQLHPLGSYADISIDHSNFFDNNQDSLKISFNIEDTNQGKPESDGWIVVSRTIEKSIYGTDALYFNMYYAGQDAKVFVRLLDRDNEYWVCPIYVSLNAKQQVILKFSDFVQRTTADVTVANMTFDYERIKYFEIVFEETFGDGILLMSGIKAIKFNNYRDYFIEKMDFTAYSDDKWVNENYTFDKVITENELTLKYYSTTAGKPKINGYGFAKLNVNQYFYSGDSVKVSIKYTGNAGDNKTNAIIRILEEDKDRWSYKFPFSSISSTYKTVIIPFAAFAKSDIQGDGKRQFYSINNIQFGLEGQYGEGTLSYKDFEIVYKKDYVVEKERPVYANGLIENFNNYTSSSDVFLAWDLTDSNKDEYISLNNTAKIGGAENPYSGQFEYKSDMVAAQYTLPITTTSTFSSFSIWMKDASNKTGDARFGHVTNWSATVNIYIALESDEIFRYELGTIERVWTEYNIPFSLFECINKQEIDHLPNDITGKNISSIGFTLQYFYYNAAGMAQPQYTNSNPVYVDNIYLGQESKMSIYEREKIIRMKDDVAPIDDFEMYNSSSDLTDNWADGYDYDYQLKELSTNVSKEGGNQSMALQLKAGDKSPSYYIAPAFAPDVLARAIKVSMYSEKALTVYVNLYLTIGTAKFQYRATLTDINTEWSEYTIGFNNFAIVSGFARPLSAPDIIYMTKLSFGMVYSDGTSNLYKLYIDNLMFDYNQLYSVNTRRIIGE